MVCVVVRMPSPPEEELRRKSSLDQQIHMITRKRPIEEIIERAPSPPVKSSKNIEEDTGFHDLLSRIPRDVKLTRAQFEELMKAHKAKHELSPALSNAPARESEFDFNPHYCEITVQVINIGDGLPSGVSVA